MIIRKTRPEEGKRVNTLFAIAFEQPMMRCNGCRMWRSTGKTRRWKGFSIGKSSGSGIISEKNLFTQPSLTFEKCTDILNVRST